MYLSLSVYIYGMTPNPPVLNKEILGLHGKGDGGGWVAGDIACEVGGVDGLGSGLARLGCFFHSARLGSVRPTSALLVSAWLGLLLGPPFLISWLPGSHPSNYLHIPPPRKVACPGM